MILAIYAANIFQHMSPCNVDHEKRLNSMPASDCPPNVPCANSAINGVTTTQLCFQVFELVHFTAF